MSEKDLKEAELKTGEPEEKPMPIYARGNNLDPEQVNSFIALGYTPWQITTSPKRVIRSGNLVTEEVDIIYHFIRKGTAK